MGVRLGFAGSLALMGAAVAAGCARVEHEIYLVPDGTIGPVLVIYDRPGGQPPEFDEQSRVYRIPDYGVLLTQQPYPQIRRTETWYVDAKGRQSELLHFIGNCGNYSVDLQGSPVPDDEVIACVAISVMVRDGVELPAYRGLYVGRVEDMARMWVEYGRMIDEYLVPLATGTAK